MFYLELQGYVLKVENITDIILRAETIFIHNVLN